MPFNLMLLNNASCIKDDWKTEKKTGFCRRAFSYELASGSDFALLMTSEASHLHWHVNSL